MAKANVILQNSILWNLREVTKLAEKIKSRCGDVDCVSWRYPLASCSELEIFKLLQTNRNLDNYTYILELTYDRLLYLFNLMIKYLESVESLKKFRPSKNVYRPRTLSLASVLHMIWDRIQAHVENAGKESFPRPLEQGESEKTLIVTDLSNSKSSICTQSEVCSISVCSCCEMVQTFITQLVLEMEKLFENQDFSSAISNERKIMREYLVEMTSWSAMTRWLTAIAKDFATLSEKLDQVTTSSRKLRRRLDSGERKMKTKEEDTRKLEIRIKDKESKILEFKQKIDKLTEEKNNLTETVKHRTSELEMNTQKMEQLRKKLKEKKERKEKEEEDREALKRSLAAERKKLEEVERQNEKLEEIVLKLKEGFESLNSKSDEDKSCLLNRLNDMESKIESLNQENLRMSSVIEEKEKIIKDYSERIMEAFPELTDVPKPKYAASGNPETDMENQIEANRLRIELLKSENEKLQNTLIKIKSLKG